MPDVYQHVANVGLPWPVITTKWFVCLFAEVLPIEVYQKAIKILDRFFIYLYLYKHHLFYT